MTPVTVQDWIQAGLESLEEVATQALGFEEGHVRRHSVPPPDGAKGSFVPLMSGLSSTQIGISASEGDCERLTRALLGMEDDEEVANDDVTDAMGEIANMLAGGVKRRLDEREGGLQLGLPIFVDGRVEPSHGAESSNNGLRLGTVSATLKVIRARKT